MKLIGMVHLKTLPGYPQFKCMEHVLKKALEDALRLEKGGVDAILIENSDDDPHRKTVGQETIAAITIIAQKIKEQVRVPLGLCILWNDYKAALAIAKVVGADFVRVPVFTEAVLTSCGMIEGDPYDVICYRRLIGAENVKILADVHVKHSTVLSKRSIWESAREALGFGADEIIITGRFTGDSPDIKELEEVRLKCPEAKIVIGSGTDADNIVLLRRFADRFIVGTYFKDENFDIDINKVGVLKMMLSDKKNNS
jgi:membrane complex biogenesis BtpA family protein